MPLFFQNNPEADEPSAPQAPAPDGTAKPTWIGKALRINGEISAGENIFIQGFLQGKVESNAQVVIQSEGRLQADVIARRIEVHGTVVGDLVASESVILGAEARLTGNITAPSVAVTPGAAFHGLTRTGKDSGEAGASDSGDEKNEDETE